MCKIWLQINVSKAFANRIFMNKTIKWPFLGLFIIVIVFFTGCSSQEKQTNQPISVVNSPIKSNDNIFFFLGEQNYAPISFEENGQVVGISPDIITEAFRRMGYKIKLQLVPWKRAQEMVKDGEADGFFSPYKSTEREKIYQYPSEPLLIEKNVFMVRKDSNITYEGDMRKLSHYGIGTLIGYTTLDKYMENKIISTVDKSANVEASLNKLISGERQVDLVVNTDYILWYTAKKMNIMDSVKELPFPLAETPSYLAFNKEKDYTQVMAKFETELKKMKNDGTYQQIIEKYIGK